MATDPLAALAALPYCGAAAVPGELGQRWNLDPWLIAAFVAGAACYAARAGRLPVAVRARFAAGWTLALLAFVSPLCAWAVALFSVRVGQHMLLALVAAPLLAAGLPGWRARPGAASLAFLVTLWAWHFPPAYAAALASDAVYWAMQVAYTTSAVWLWQALLPRGVEGVRGGAVMAGIATTLHMGVLGALLTFAPRPLYGWHLDTTAAWGLSPLADQQLAGLLMWVPGGIAFGLIGLWAFARWWRAAAQAQLQGGSSMIGKPVSTVAARPTP